jgi:hypothetical protein
MTAVSGDKTLGAIERYTQAADRARLSKAAVDPLSDED